MSSSVLKGPQNHAKPKRQRIWVKPKSQALGLQARDHQDQDRQEVKCKSHISQKLNTFVGSRNCDYACERNGGCKVTYVGPPRAGRTQVKHASNFFLVSPQFQYRQCQGSCFPRDFGGSCSAQCVLCKVYFSAQPNNLKPILKFQKYYPIEHIFVPACSSARKIHFFKF